MKKILTTAFFICATFFLIYSQNGYKMNFLDLLKKIPEIKSCENSYNFFKCSNNSCKDYKSAKNTIETAGKELSNAQLTISNSVTPGQPTTTMSEKDGKALQEKLSKMSDAEKQQWAMQNAQSYMNPGAGHVNQDAGNDVVNDAVNYVTKQQQEDMKDAMIPNDLSAQLKKIEDKYQSQKNAILKTLQDALGDKNVTLSTYSYGSGEASDAEIARQTKAINDFKKNITPVYNAELNDKLAYLKTLNQNLIAKYNMLEEKIAATHYADDAEEATNKSPLLMMHQNILNRVNENLSAFEDLILEYANIYADMQKVERVKEI